MGLSYIWGSWLFIKLSQKDLVFEIKLFMSPLFIVLTYHEDAWICLNVGWCLNTKKIFWRQCKSWNSSTYNFLQSPASSYLSGPYIQCSTLSRINSGCVLPEHDEISRPHKIIGKTTIIYIFIIIFLDTKWEDQMVEGIPWIYTVLNFFILQVLDTDLWLSSRLKALHQTLRFSADVEPSRRK